MSEQPFTFLVFRARRMMQEGLSPPQTPPNPVLHLPALPGQTSRPDVLVPPPVTPMSSATFAYQNRTRRSRVLDAPPSSQDVPGRASRPALHKNFDALLSRRSPLKENQMELKVFCGTWNLHAKPPPDDISSFILLDFDIYVVGTSECEHSQAASIFFSKTPKWTKHLQQTLGVEYVKLAHKDLAAIHIICFVRRSLVAKISGVDTARVSTKFGGLKGAAAVCFDVGGTSFLFINSHFHAHQNKVHQRNQDYYSINLKLKLRKPAKPCPLDMINATDRFDRVFWMGDLNYRVNGTRKMVDSLVERQLFDVMLANDQLLIERRQPLGVFSGFQEGELTFPPTYKFDKRSDVYDSSKKQRVPSWTDRILFKDVEDCVFLRKYDSVSSIKTSDHRPVYATFTVTATEGTSGVHAGDLPTVPQSDSGCVIC